MKGIILAGGTGSRLYPLTKVTNKHLLPVYDRPMIYYPLQTLLTAGIKDIMIVSGRGHAGHFLELLGSGAEFNARLTYEIQDEAGGIAQALALAEDFADDDNVTVILGDNIFQDSVKDAVQSFESGARIFLKPVPDAARFGVAEVDENRGRVLGIEEKPAVPKSDYAVTGLYIYESGVFDVIKTLKPSGRGELEITDVNNEYIRQGAMGYSVLDGDWRDAGTFESLLRAGWLRSFEKMRRNMTIMITSGAGFIGSHLCERLLAKGGVVCPLTGSQKDMACVKVDGEQYFLRQGESTVIRDGVKHRLSNPGKVGLEIIEVQLGEDLGEDDIVRFDDEYGRE